MVSREREPHAHPAGSALILRSAMWTISTFLKRRSLLQLVVAPIKLIEFLSLFLSLFLPTSIYQTQNGSSSRSEYSGSRFLEIISDNQVVSTCIVVATGEGGERGGGEGVGGSGEGCCRKWVISGGRNVPRFSSVTRYSCPTRTIRVEMNERWTLQLPPGLSRCASSIEDNSPLSLFERVPENTGGRRVRSLSLFICRLRFPRANRVRPRVERAFR